MFGGNAFAKPATTTGFGTFGGTSNQNNAQPTGSLFGAFGAQNQNQQQQQQQQQPTAATGQATTGNSLFAPQNTATNSLFGGAKPAGSSLFGASQPASGTGAFGATNAGQGAPNAFGAPAGNTNPLFGSTTTNQPAQTTNIFGQSTQPTNATQPSTGTSLFGQQTQQNPTPATSLFGQQPQQQQQQQQQSTPNFFAQSNRPQQQQSQPGAFGGFAQQTQPSTNLGGSTLFGSNKPGSTQLGLSNAGASTSTIFAPRTSILQPQNDSAQAQFTNLAQKIESVAQAWDASSPQCRFQHFFYNLVDPNQVQFYGRPQNATNEALWQKAVRENPDPSCYVPALAVGYDDLQKRVEAQRSQASAHQTKLEELKKRIAALSTTHSTSHTPRLQRALAVQTQLQQRIVRLVQHLHLLIPSVRSSSIRPEEEALRSILESLEEEIRKPGGVGRLKGKLSELWAVIGAIEAARGRERKNGESNIEWAVVDSEGLQRLAQILAEEQNGIAHLTKIVKGHQKDLDIILGKAPQEREPDAFSNSQASQMLLGASLRGTQ